MGSCSSHEEINIKSKKIIRANYVCNSSKYAMGLLHLLDLESLEQFNYNVKLFPFKNFETISQISIDNHLYLIGEQEVQLNNGSTFIRIDLFSKSNMVNLLINSTYEHYKPSLTIFKKEFVIAVGGKLSTKCEIYHINSNKWRTLPDLPEERYGCNLISDDKNDFLYCFGGYNSKTNEYHNNVLKINLKRSNSWDVFMTYDPKNNNNVKYNNDNSLICNDSNIRYNNYQTLERAFFSIVRISFDKILMLGGQTPSKECTDDVVEFSFTNKAFIYLNFKLSSPSKFDVYSFGELNNFYYTIDEDGLIHKISKKNKTTDIIQNNAINIKQQTDLKDISTC